VEFRSLHPIEHEISKSHTFLQDLSTGEGSAMKENIAGNVDEVTKHLLYFESNVFLQSLISDPSEVEILAS
jgi:hypothetical protein